MHLECIGPLDPIEREKVTLPSVAMKWIGRYKEESVSPYTNSGSGYVLRVQRAQNSLVTLPEAKGRTKGLFIIDMRARENFLVP